MTTLRQNLYPDEMQDIPTGAQDITPWIGPNDNIITIRTPDGLRYIRDNTANVYRPQPYKFWDKSQDPTYKNSAFNPTERPMIQQDSPFQRVNINPDTMSFDEMQDLAKEIPPGPPPPPNFYATNIPSTAARWNQEGKIGQEGQDNFAFLTNTPEETTEAKMKGYGKWGKIIGPPEAAVTAKAKPKEESPYPGQPPSDEQIGDYQKFNGLWNAHVQKNWGGQDPLKLNPIDAREAAVKPLKEQNAQFIYDYETYGPQQMGQDATLRYNRLQKQIKETGDLTEEKIKNAQAIAHQEKTSAYNFYEKFKKEQAELGKLSKEDQQELISMRQEMTSLRRDAKDIMLSPAEKSEAQTRLTALQQRESQILKKEGGGQTKTGRSIEKGLTYMKGITDRNEIVKRAGVLAKQYGWSKEELNRLGKELGF
jgi:hypothetical protein